jgi:hypothetical protein
MSIIIRVKKINDVLNNYFKKNPDKDLISAKDFMHLFISEGIYVKDVKNGRPLRDDLRWLDKENKLDLLPYIYPDRKNSRTYWYFMNDKHILIKDISYPKKNIKTSIKVSNSDKDEHYVIDLCDEILKQTSSRQHKFDFLLGDYHKDGVSRSKLPVDAFYSDLNLVVEYMERQHTEAVGFFDKPDVKTVSGVSRGEQRKIYDKRRKDVLPLHGIDLKIISYFDFKFDNQKRIIRNRENDLNIVRVLLDSYLK